MKKPTNDKHQYITQKDALAITFSFGALCTLMTLVFMS